MVTDVMRSWWAEPRASHPPRRGWPDWLLVAVISVSATVEITLRDDAVWPVVGWLLAVALAVALLWRRTHPLGAVLFAFGAGSLVSLSVLVLLEDLPAGDEAVGLYTSLSIVLFPYALLRWGSGRDAVLGLAMILVAYALGIATGFTGYVDAILAALFLLFPAALGASIRYRAASRLRELDQVKMRERAELARELHDTVAHHVSAIAIRAQAGRVLASGDPPAAVQALAVIEEEASRTLAEMRTMVGGLRDDEGATLAPPAGVSDLDRLARDLGDGPQVVVERSGDLADLRPAVGAAIFRIAQESVTNAVRHARHATRVAVAVEGGADAVRLTVCDDGQPGVGGRSPEGYGLIGMAERAALLGGTLEAGPGPGTGWTVTAVLPRQAAVR